jgi:hypothetical protein
MFAIVYLIICRGIRLDMRILTVAFLALIGAFLAAGTAMAGSDTASGVQNSATPASGSNTASGVQNSATPQLQFFPPTAYGSPCSPGAPVVAWNGAGSGKGTYCIALPICATGQLLTTVADGNGNPSFICVDPSTGSTAAATPTDGSSTSGSSSSSQTGSATPTSASTPTTTQYLSLPPDQTPPAGSAYTGTNGCSATYLYTDPTTGNNVYDYGSGCPVTP